MGIAKQDDLIRVVSFNRGQSMSDSEPLLEEASPNWRRRSAFICIGIFLCGCLALASAILASYFLLYSKNVVGLKVMSLNTWGMPASFGSYDKEDRMIAIGRHIQKAEYDLYLLEELWMRPDHATIKSFVPEGYHMTEVGDLASSCDGYVGPEGCSGLAIVSRYPFLDIQFHPYSDHGDALWGDGEYFARKGAWLTPSKATYGNPANTYSAQYTPVLYDYIFTKPGHNNTIWTNYFEVPFLKFLKNNLYNQSETSFSDHEAVTAKLHLWKPTL